jgi:type IV secretory pathway VirB2 component (pilin)
MTRSADTPTTRELARRLLAYEAAEAGTAKADTQAVCRVCDKLRRPLTTLAGAAGFRSLLARALTLAKQEAPLLGAWEVKSDGSLQVLTGETAQSGAVLIAQLIGLMITFIGESLTLRLLHDVWLDLPDAEVKFERDESK